MKHNPITHSSILLLGTAISTAALGSGFALNEQSARSTGQAFSGRASDADNASTLMTNPAGMSLLKHAELSAGASFIDASSDIRNVSSTAASPLNNVSGTSDGDMIPFTTIPFGYYVQPINEHWAVGFGIYAPFGLSTEHEDTSKGRYFGTTSDISVITFQPTVSYKLANNLSFGLGVTYNSFEGKLEKAVFTGGADALASVKGDDTAWGYNIGAIYEFSERTRVGLTYYSKVKYTLDGHTSLSSVPLQLGGPSLKLDSTLDIETPDRIDLGITHELTPALTLHGEVARTNWSTLDEIRVENKTSIPPFKTSVEPLDWNPTMMYSLGLSYKLHPQWTLRGGIAYDEQPMSNATRSVRLPAGNRKIFSLGTTWSAMSNLDIDLAYMYLKEDSVTVNQQTTTLSGGLPIKYSANFENTINIFSVQSSWKF